MVLVLDCGSTNLRAAAVNPRGEIVAQASRPNRSLPQPGGKPGWTVWDLEEILRKLSQASREVSSTVGPENVKALILTTWGADGAPVRRDGSLTYHPISWMCPRTKGIASEILKWMDAWDIFRITGYQVISFNTLLRLIWLRRHCPKALEEAYTWLMMPGLLVQRLTGEFHIEPTSGSTMMTMDLKRRDWSSTMLELAGLDAGFFPEWSQPGDVIGYTTEAASRRFMVPRGTPVIVGGHDTQFAILGSCAQAGYLTLSSGTWEILGVRVDAFKPTRIGFENGLIIEADVQPSLWNPQILMMGSAVLEWIREMLFAEIERGDYAAMIKEAEEAPPGANGLFLVPSFVKESGPTRKFKTLGTLLGLTLRTKRGHIYRAALEGLSFQLREAVKILTEATDFKAQGIRVVGGGSKNDLWNRIRADVTGLPISVPVREESTVLGAAMVAFLGIGRYSSLEEAGEAMCPDERTFRPGVNKELYDGLFERYSEIPVTLESFYERVHEETGQR